MVCQSSFDLRLYNNQNYTGVFVSNHGFIFKIHSVCMHAEKWVFGNSRVPQWNSDVLRHYCSVELAMKTCCKAADGQIKGIFVEFYQLWAPVILGTWAVNTQHWDKAINRVWFQVLRDKNISIKYGCCYNLENIITALTVLSLKLWSSIINFAVVITVTVITATVILPC